MKIRIMGFRDECTAFADMVRETVDPRYIRNISDFYPNRKGYSNEGRVYIDVDLPEGAERIPKRIHLKDPCETLLEHWGDER